MTIRRRTRIDFNEMLNTSSASIVEQIQVDFPESPLLSPVTLGSSGAHSLISRDHINHPTQNAEYVPLFDTIVNPSMKYTLGSGSTSTPWTDSHNVFDVPSPLIPLNGLHIYFDTHAPVSNFAM